MKINSEYFKRSNQVDVKKFIRKYVEPSLQSSFYRAFYRWDESLKRLHVNDFPSYDEGVCWMMLNEAYGN